MYKAIKNFETLIENQTYKEEEINELYDETTILSLISAGVLEIITDSISRRDRTQVENTLITE
jgi:hypothetical protein